MTFRSELHFHAVLEQHRALSAALSLPSEDFPLLNHSIFKPFERYSDRLLVRQFQSRFAKAMEIFEAGIDDVLSYLHYPQPHRVRISSTNPLERLNLEIRRRTRVVGIFPNPAACLRLIGMLLVEKNDDWLTDDKAYLTFDDTPLEESAAKVVSMAASQ